MSRRRGGRRCPSRTCPGATGSSGGGGLGLAGLPIGPDEVGQPVGPGPVDPEGGLEARAPEVGRHHDHPAAGQRPRHGEVGGDERLAVSGLRAGDGDDRALLVDEQHPQAGPEIADRLGQCRLRRLDQGEGHLPLPDIGVLGQFAQDRSVDLRRDVGTHPDAVVELLAYEGDPATDEEPGDQPDGAQLRGGETGRGARGGGDLDHGVGHADLDGGLGGLQGAGLLGERGDLAATPTSRTRPGPAGWRSSH